MMDLRSFILESPADSVNKSRRRVVRLATASRLIVLVCMIISDALVPDFVDPGNDVLRFDLRLQNEGPQCFCLEGHACDTEQGNNQSAMHPDHQKCASNSHMKGVSRAKFHSLLLEPFTRWDASRFLTLAVDPRARQPTLLSENDGQCPLDNGDQTCQNDPFTMSEQAHAFFPLFPILIRYTALALTWIFPPTLLPPTFEGVAVVAGLTLNFVCFVLAALVLHDLTYRIEARQTCSGARSTGVSADRKQRALYHAQVTVTLFCINPVSVFFSSVYSESLFCLLTFLGYNLDTRGLMWGSALMWSIASFVRSNGTMASLWLLISGFATVTMSVHVGSSPIKYLRLSLHYMFLAMIVILPVLHHDYTGVALHCSSESTLLPKWCQDASGHPFTFSLYGFVQRKHWNVGFLRYYELQQIPNFLLAAPVLWLGFSAALEWIRGSWCSYESTSTKAVFSWKNPVHVVQWAFFALRSSVTQDSEAPEVHDLLLLTGPHVLPHFAVLAASSIVGATVAHVQVSTRLIFSSCPAIYWHMTKKVVSSHNTNGAKKHEFGYGQAVLYYCLAYVVVGIFMHVNWLPWT